MAFDVVVVGEHAYVAASASGLQVIDITSPTSPEIVGSVDTPGGAKGVAVAGTHAYVADGPIPPELRSRLQVIDISDPTAPQIVGSVDTRYAINDVAVAGTHAYIADADSGLQVIDISEPASPEIVGSVDTPGIAYAVALAGSHAYVADGTYGGLQVIDISNPTSPRMVGSVKTPDWAKAVTVAGNLVFVADADSGLQIFPSQCEDLVPPDLALGILQNPYLSQYLDIYFLGSEALDSATVELEVDDETIAIQLIDQANNVWLADYKLPDATSMIALTGCASDVVGNDTCVTATFSSSLLYATEGGHASSPDGRVSVCIDAEVLASDMHLIIAPCRGVEDGSQSVDSKDRTGSLRLLAADGTTPTTYYISPPAALGRETAYVEFHYKESDLGPDGTADQLYIEQEGVGPLECRVNTGSGTVGAEVSKLGGFRLVLGSPGSSEVADARYLRVHAGFPNPFATSAAIRYEVRARMHTRVTIYDVRGRVVRRLLNESVYPGMHEVHWDGTVMSGGNAASGFYFVKVETEHTSSTVKISKLR
jgi:hypothetical protein